MKEIKSLKDRVENERVIREREIELKNIEIDNLNGKLNKLREKIDREKEQQLNYKRVCTTSY